MTIVPQKWKDVQVSRFKKGDRVLVGEASGVVEGIYKVVGSPRFEVDVRMDDGRMLLDTPERKIRRHDT